MALYWLDVSNITRRQAPGTLQAHGNYVLRESARQHVVSVNFPTNKHAIKRELEQYETWAETNTRKDARLVYKIMHALPVELSRKGQIEATRRFLWSLTMKGRGRGFAAFHDLDTGNPHVHIVFIDRDGGTGKSVALLSASKSERAAKGLEPNSTEWLRQLWELECNGVLAEHGLDVRIDRRSNLERGIAAAAEQHRGWKKQAEEEVAGFVPDRAGELAEDSHIDPAGFDDESPLPGEIPLEDDQLSDEIGDLDDAPERPPMPVEEEEPESYEGDDEFPLEDDMAAPLKAQDVSFASSLYQELQFLKDTQAKAEHLAARLDSAKERLQHAEEAAPEATEAMHTAQQKVYQARENLSQYQRKNGKLKGINLFGVWKSETRQLGEAAALRLDFLQSHEANAVRDYEAAQARVERFRNEVTTLTAERDSVQQDLQRIEQTFGKGKTLEEAEIYLNFNIEDNLRDVSEDDLLQMVQDGEISEGEYVDALNVLNTPKAKERLHEFDQSEGY